MNRWILMVVMVFLPLVLAGQKPKTGLFGKAKQQKVMKTKVSPKVSKAQKKAEKVKKQQKKDYEKARKKVVERRHKMQTKKTQTRMKQTKKEAMEFNEGEKSSFFNKLFSGKGKKKKKHKKISHE